MEDKLHENKRSDIENNKEWLEEFIRLEKDRKPFLHSSSATFGYNVHIIMGQP